MFILNLSAQVPSGISCLWHGLAKRKTTKKNSYKKTTELVTQCHKLKMTTSSLLRLRSIFCVPQLRVFWPFVQRDLCANQIKSVRHLRRIKQKVTTMFFHFCKDKSSEKIFIYQAMFWAYLFNLFIIFGCSVVYFIPLLARKAGFEQ